MVPLGGVEQVPGEGVDALDVGELRCREPAGGVDERGAGQLAGRGAHPPQQRVVVPAPPRAARRRSGSGRARRPRRRPSRGRPGSRPAASRRATSRGSARTRSCRAGSGRRTSRPGRCWPTRCRRAPSVLLDDEELLAVLLQPDRQRDPGEPGADDEVVDVGGEGHVTETLPTVAGRPSCRRGSAAHRHETAAGSLRDGRRATFPVTARMSGTGAARPSSTIGGSARPSRSCRRVPTAGARGRRGR